MDFSDRTFADFFSEELRVDIDDPKYFQGGGSKGRRLRAFLQIEQEPLAARGLRKLWEYRDAINGPASSTDEKPDIRTTGSLTWFMRWTAKAVSVGRSQKARRPLLSIPLNRRWRN
ncbi:hypothetical protein [Acidisoma sp. S159]|uniref:hypothetical protein n=1 Tax=Acidisoma sp. S159 TaxID=1747225 RepID=UPI00131B0881|nr:hypothetical protein [Acidisoma sp. S159]